MILPRLDFMLYFVRPSGRVNFDIMNKDSEWNKAMAARKKAFFILTMGKNFIKFLANLVTPVRYVIDNRFDVRDNRYSPNKIEAILKDRSLACETLTLEQIEAHAGGGECSFSPDQKLVYAVNKSSQALEYFFSK